MTWWVNGLELTTGCTYRPLDPGDELGYGLIAPCAEAQHALGGSAAPGVEVAHVCGRKGRRGKEGKERKEGKEGEMRDKRE